MSNKILSLIPAYYKSVRISAVIDGPHAHLPSWWWTTARAASCRMMEAILDSAEQGFEFEVRMIVEWVI
jgi:hypothetical protein